MTNKKNNLDAKYLLLRGSLRSNKEEYKRKSPNRRARICLDGFGSYDKIINELYQLVHVRGWNFPKVEELIAVTRPPFSPDDLRRKVEGKTPYVVILQTFRKYRDEDCEGNPLPTYEIENCSEEGIRQTIKEMLSAESDPNRAISPSDINNCDLKIAFGLELKVDMDAAKAINQRLRDKVLDERVNEIIRGKENDT